MNDESGLGRIAGSGHPAIQPELVSLYGGDDGLHNVPPHGVPVADGDLVPGAEPAGVYDLHGPAVLLGRDRQAAFRVSLLAEDGVGPGALERHVAPQVNRLTQQVRARWKGHEAARGREGIDCFLDAGRRRIGLTEVCRCESVAPFAAQGRCRCRYGHEADDPEQAGQRLHVHGPILHLSRKTYYRYSTRPSRLCRSRGPRDS